MMKNPPKGVCEMQMKNADENADEIADLRKEVGSFLNGNGGSLVDARQLH